jgi:hypothetical protein
MWKRFGLGLNLELAEYRAISFLIILSRPYKGKIFSTLLGLPLMKTTFWQQEWKKAIFLGLDGNEERREAYMDRLKVTHVRPKEDEDELVWSKNPSLGFYTP